MTTTILEITGMHCTSCKKLIEDVCKEVSGVHACTVDVQAGKATVEHDASLDLAALKREISSLGSYSVTERV
ncbi:heavy-metal-associated domain-containing protein [Candidatus Uhrbacteria bacterium]|nr:heavy-metal-associated domain-containing protein [Candidatus Uhrbacteria bacterium]